MSMLTPPTGKELYDPLSENAWRLVLLLVIGMMIIYQVARQLKATLKTVKAKTHWIKWQTEKLEKDLEFCHPRWPQEAKAVKYEIKRVNKLKGFSAEDAWFYYDWIVLIVMIAAIVMHIVYYQVAHDDIRYVYTRILSIANLIVSLRLLEIMRPFPGIGTLVIILGETSGDFINWAFLFFLLLVPFTASFWIIFGGLSLTPVTSFDKTDSLLFSVFRMAVGDEFNLEGLVEAEPVMARILTAVYVTAMTIVTLNLLIALLSDTFTRVHGNAVVNTIMQRAIKVIEAERALTKTKKQNYRDYVKMSCSPEVIDSVVSIPDQDSIASSQALTTNLTALKGLLDDRFAKVYGKDKVSDFDKLKGDISLIKQRQKRDYDDLTAILRMLKQLGGSDVGSSSHKKIKMPNLSIFGEKIHLPLKEKKGDGKSKRKKRPGDQKQRKSEPRRKDKKIERKSEIPEFSIVPYRGVDRAENVSQREQRQEDLSNDEGWDTISADSINL